jgi:undecaprenyl-diphosphatase
MIESLDQIDRAIFLGINSFHLEWLNPLMKIFSGQIIWFPLIAFLIYKARPLYPQKKIFIFLAFILLVIIASDVTSSYLIKNFANRLRPCRIPELKELIYQFGQKCGGKYGFVSSHAANTMGLITFTFFTLGLNLKKFWWFWTLPVLVGWSRIYLGVHYPGDIIGGFSVGFIWGYVFYLIIKNSPKVQAVDGPKLKLL